MRTSLALAFLSACQPTTVTPFAAVDGDGMERVDLLIEGVGFDELEGAMLWTEVLEAESPPMPTEIVDGELLVLLPESYAPGSAIFLTVSILVDYDHDAWCGPEDMQIYAPAIVVVDEDPAIAFMELHDPDVIVEPCH